MENTAKNFALQLGSLISLYISITAFITLLFGIITVMYPDPANGYWEYDSASGSIRFGIALLIVFFPTYLTLTRMVNTIRRTEHGVYLTLTKWLIYLSLLVGGAALLGDLVAVVNSFLNGEFSTRFLLKALAFLFVVGAAFVYYILDARGYWQTHEKQSVQYGVAMSISVIAALVLGFVRIDPPAQVRELKLDTQQINDLSMMQSQVIEYYRIHETLPASIDDAYQGMSVPTAPENRLPYEYTVTGTTTFELCADFKNATSKAEQSALITPVYYEDTLLKNPFNWNHEAGRWCFERYIQEKPVNVR